MYADGLPRNAAGKLLRIRLAERLGLDEKSADERLGPAERLFECCCPPQGSPLWAPIKVPMPCSLT